LIDNNSPHDDFKKIVDSYEGISIKYVKTDKTVPQDENFNNAFRYAETPFVTILHDDDMLHIQFVEMAQKIFMKYGESIGGFVVKNKVSEVEWEGIYRHVQLTEDIKQVDEAFFYFAQLSPFPGVVVNKDLALQIGGFKADLHPIADFDFWYRYSIQKPMLMVNQYLAYYRISPTQSTNHLIDAMINNIYEYRLKLIKNSRYNNFMTRLALEQSRIINIRFFKKTYPTIPLPEEIINRDSMERAQRLFKIPYLYNIIGKYKKFISFTKPNVQTKYKTKS
jgi:hypothetical protein